jgi:hypothetical protein
VIESLGEAMALVGKGGVGRHQYLDILTSTLFNAPIYKTYGALIADRKIFARRFRGTPWPEGHPSDPRGSRRVVRAVAACEPPA